MIRHILPRFLIGAIAFVLLGTQLLETNEGGGHTGMDIKLWLFISLAVLLLEGLYLVGEIVFFVYKSRYKLAIVDLGLLVLGILTFLVLASR